jgi:FMN phosphatase YigB (HAD superfamily)
MVSDITRLQIEALDIKPNRPLVICDVDEVVVHFTRDFETYLGQYDMWLETTAFALNGMIMSRATGKPILSHDVGPLIEQFFADRTLHLEPIDGAVEALLDIARHAEIVMLTNLPHTSAEHRRQNLKQHGLSFPVVTNSGPKGPAVSLLAAKSPHAAVFIDDSPSFITSARDHASHVHLIHFMHDGRFSRHVKPLEFVSLRTDNWAEAGSHILQLIGQRVVELT